MMRAFIATRLTPTTAVADLLRRLESFGRAVRPVAREHLHLTLRFLGDIDPADSAAIAAAISAAAAAVPAFDLRLVGLGAFPRAQRPAVIWLGLHHAEPLDRIVAALDPQLDALGLSPRDRPWQPHLTLARVKARPPAELIDLVQRGAADDFGCHPVTAVQLVHSQLSPAGPIYTDLHRIELPRA